MEFGPIGLTPLDFMRDKVSKKWPIGQLWPGQSSCKHFCNLQSNCKFLACHYNKNLLLLKVSLPFLAMPGFPRVFEQPPLPKLGQNPIFTKNLFVFWPFFCLKAALINIMIIISCIRPFWSIASESCRIYHSLSDFSLPSNYFRLLPSSHLSCCMINAYWGKVQKKRGKSLFHFFSRPSLPPRSKLMNLIIGKRK